MVVNFGEDHEFNQDDKEKMDCEAKNEELSEETVAELMKVVFSQTWREVGGFFEQIQAR